MLAFFIIFLFMQNLVQATSFPFISGDSFRAIANHIFDERTKTINPDAVRYKDIIFVHTGMLAFFFQNIHPRIKNKYILITHNSADDSPGKFEDMLADEKILVWFGKNASVHNHKKFVPIPIGLASPGFSWGNTSYITQFFQLIKPNIGRKYLLGMNFRPQTYPSERQPVYDLFSSKPFCVNLGINKRDIYYSKMAEVKFILSPRGFGLDCYRTWEALLVGTIPIVTSSPLDPLFADLPVLIIRDWNVVTEAFLNQKYEEFMKKSFRSYNYGKLFFHYWFKLIEYYQRVLN